jgi:uncharacterized membrane protein
MEAMELYLHAVGHVISLMVEAIRTFLSYFLDREVENTRRLQHERQAERAA